MPCLRGPLCRHGPMSRADNLRAFSERRPRALAPAALLGSKSSKGGRRSSRRPAALILVHGPTAALGVPATRVRLNSSSRPSGTDARRRSARGYSHFPPGLLLFGRGRGWARPKLGRAAGPADPGTGGVESGLTGATAGAAWGPGLVGGVLGEPGCNRAWRTESIERSSLPKIDLTCWNDFSDGPMSRSASSLWVRRVAYRPRDAEPWRSASIFDSTARRRDECAG